MKALTGIGLLVAALGVTGCVSAVPPLPPILTYGRADCQDVPDLSTAVSLTPDKERVLYSVGAVVDARTPCQRIGATTTPYVVYALPAQIDDKTITVGALLEPTRILSPRIAVLTADGTVSRTFRNDEFLYRGPNYSVLFRPRPEERYIHVTTEPSRVGQRYDSINIGTSTSYVSTGTYGSTITMGMDDAQSRTFSYEGTVQATVHDNDTKADD